MNKYTTDKIFFLSLDKMTNLVYAKCPLSYNNTVKSHISVYIRMDRWLKIGYHLYDFTPITEGKKNTFFCIFSKKNPKLKYSADWKVCAN